MVKEDTVMRKKSLIVLGLTIGMSLSMSLLSYASTFSEYWYQDNQGNWHIKDNNGNMVTNAWLCDDAVGSNGQDIWYLIDSNGNMVSAGLVQDQTGNIYSLETSHNGYYGMLRYKSGAYDGVYLDLESSHGGSFAKIKNQEGVTGLQGIYGLTQVNIDNSNCVYTSSFRNSNPVNGSNNTNNTTPSSNMSDYEKEKQDYERKKQEEIQKWKEDMDDSTLRPVGYLTGEEWNWH
jgi:hypothetical protein